MRAVFVTHGNGDPAAYGLLQEYLAQAARELPYPVRGLTLGTLSDALEPEDRIFALFFSEGGHVQRDLLPPVRAAGARYEGVIPASLSADLFQTVLRERYVRPGTPVVLVGVKAMTDPTLKETSLTTLAGELSRRGYPSTFALYNEEATLPSPSPGQPPPVSLLLTLLPGHTLSKAREVFRSRGLPLIAEAWLPALTPSLLQWAGDRLRHRPGPEEAR